MAEIPHRGQLLKILIQQYFPDCDVTEEYIDDMHFKYDIIAKDE